MLALVPVNATWARGRPKYRPRTTTGPCAPPDFHTYGRGPKGSSGLPLDIRHRFRNRFVGAFAVTALVVASMAWFPAAVMAVACPGIGNLTSRRCRPYRRHRDDAFTFSVKYQDNVGETPDRDPCLPVIQVSSRIDWICSRGSLTTGAILLADDHGAAVGTWTRHVPGASGTQRHLCRYL